MTIRNVGDKKILLVEDDELFRKAVCDCLSERYEIDTVESAEKALRYFETGPPDLLLLDINLPGMSGIEFLSKINSKWADLPVILVTALEEARLVVDFLQLETLDCLVKPFSSKKLLRTIENAFKAN
ncbi:response regulator [candidate division KSB1 bacterium]|nr:response regulator [candidate division KSB1 bacterium]NIR68743.1 response regulator [candidate division KSB1 bacterium]NIS25560.1 response regulator [candidate division KSB1 bacterium]NIT72454.1 response regulator [candidate division KSB1 bacterium]NIU26237.1 response regulator [candidate division KSB1 bacterium]